MVNITSQAEKQEIMSHWWEEDTSATLRVTCKACGTVYDVALSLSDTGGVKLLAVEGFCDGHKCNLGIGEGSDDD
jgi:uncharacterized Zn finger protein